MKQQPTVKRPTTVHHPRASRASRPATREDTDRTSSDPGMTIDELARSSGVTTRNIRAYASKGLLPPPRLVGRKGYYGVRHVQRLADVKRLLDRGFKTSSIRSLLADFEQGSTLSDALGIRDQQASAEGAPLSRVELERLFPEVQQDPSLLARAAAAGLFELNGDDVFIPNPLLIEVGLKMTRSGIPMTAAIRAFEQLVDDIRPAARRYADLLREYVWEHGRAARTAKTSAEFRNNASVLIPLARVAVASTFARELRALLGEAFGGEAQQSATVRSSSRSRGRRSGVRGG